MLKNNWQTTDVFKNTDANDVADKVNENTIHKETKLNETKSIHGLKYKENENVLVFESANGDVVIGGSEQELDSHKEQKVSDTDGVHGIRLNEDKLEVNINGEWVDISDSISSDDFTGLLSPITNIKIKVANEKITLFWEDPENENWNGTKVFYKIGSYPENLKDGTLVIDNKVKDKYKENGLEITGLVNDEEYYFTFFPYDTDNKYSLNIENRTTGSPKKFKYMDVMFNLDNSNPDTNGSYGKDALNIQPKSKDWDEFFGHFPCLFKNGEIVGRLKKENRNYFEDGREADLTSGNEGNVMIAFPKRRSKLMMVNNTLHVSVTDDFNIEDGYDDLAFRRDLDPKDYFFIGAYKGSLINGKLCSLKGKKPLVSVTIGQARQYAQANGKGYDQLMFYPLTYLQKLYCLYSKNLNSQKVIGIGYVDIASNGSAFTTGGTEDKPTWGETTGKQHMSFLGIEDFWGNVLDWVDGCKTNGGNLWTSTNNFSDSSTTGYKNCGSIPSSYLNGYIRNVYGDNNRGFIIKSTGGSETTYFCDYGYIGNNYFPFFGGDWSNGSYAGAFRFDLYGSASHSSSAVGARLMFL